MIDVDERLPPAAHVLLLHLAARRDTERRARGGARARVDYRDRIAGALGQRLVHFHLLLLLLLEAGGWVVGGWGGREEERGRWLGLLREWRALRRAGRER